jgi:hypothetical protein
MFNGFMLLSFILCHEGRDVNDILSFYGVCGYTKCGCGSGGLKNIEKTWRCILVQAIGALHATTVVLCI